MRSNKNASIFFSLKKRRVKRFLLFVIIAFVFLIFSKLSNTYEKRIMLNVNLTNVADEILLQEDSLNSITAYVKAKGFSLLYYIFNKPKEINFNVETDAISTKDSYTFDIQKQKFLIEDQLGEAFKIESLKPDTLLIQYFKLATKVVPIKLNHKINYAFGYDLKDDFILSPDSVKIVGPAIQIDEISSLTTKRLLLNNVSKTVNSNLEIDVLPYNAIEVFPKFITISGEVARFTEGVVEVPITIVNKPAVTKINYFPKKVKVFYYVDLERFNTITPKDFVVECNYSKSKKEYLVPELTKKPEFVKRASVNEKRIDFIKL